MGCLWFRVSCIVVPGVVAGTSFSKSTRHHCRYLAFPFQGTGTGTGTCALRRVWKQAMAGFWDDSYKLQDPTSLRLALPFSLPFSFSPSLFPSVLPPCLPSPSLSFILLVLLALAFPLPLYLFVCFLATHARAARVHVLGHSNLPQWNSCNDAWSSYLPSNEQCGCSSGPYGLEQ